MFDPRIQYGDPYQVGRLSSDLHELAGRIRERAEAVKKRAEAIGFEGPKAERFRERVATGREKVGAVAAELDFLADSLLLVAAAAQANIDAYERATEYNPYENL